MKTAETARLAFVSDEKTSKVRGYMVLLKPEEKSSNEATERTLNLVCE